MSFKFASQTKHLQWSFEKIKRCRDLLKPEVSAQGARHAGKQSYLEQFFEKPSCFNGMVKTLDQ